MKSSARAATRWDGEVGWVKDFESGERHSGWLVMKVGFVHCGSRYIEASSSRRRGRVGSSGRGRERSVKRVLRWSGASGVVRSGSLRPVCSSMPIMKSMRRNGGEKSASVGFRVPSVLKLRMCSAIPEKSFSVVDIRSWRFA